MSGDAVHLFLNPTAGRGRARRRMPRIREILETSGRRVELHTSSAVGDVESRVLAAVDGGATRVVVAGGDGSVYEAVNGILRSSRSASLGLVPTGTGNDFAKACGVTLNWEHAARLLADRLAANQHARAIDIGVMNDRYFANGCGIGLDAEVTRLARRYRMPIGDLVYLLAIFRAMLNGIETPRLTIESDGLSWDAPATLAAISNGPWLGGMFHIAPTADNGDGRLELLIAAPVTRRRIVRLLPKLMSGTHLDEPEIHYAGVSELTVTAAEPVASHLDGEVQPLQQRFEISLLPAALRLL